MKRNNTSQQADWLVIFFILDVDNMVDELKTFFEAIQTNRLQKATKVYVLTDAIQRIREPERFTNRTLKIAEFVYDVQRRKTLLRDIDLEGVDKTKGQAWMYAIRQLYTTVQARFSALIPWSHGTGLGFVNLTSPEPTKPAVAKITSSPGETDCAATQLFFCEIGEGLAGITAKKKFDLVLVSACNTQLLDNIYNLRSIARYYFAPLGGIQTAGYDFGGFIHFINRPLPVSGIRSNTRLALTRSRKRFPIFRGFHSRLYFRRIFQLLFEEYKRKFPKEQPSEAFTVADLRAGGKIPELLNPVCDYFIANRERVYPIIREVVAHDITSLPDSDLFDLVGLLAAIRQKAADKTLDAYVTTFVGFIEQNLLADKFIGDRLANRLPPAGITCCTVYLPGNNDNRVPPGIECQYLRSHLQAAFVMDAHWAAFIADFIEWRKRQP